MRKIRANLLMRRYHPFLLDKRFYLERAVTLVNKGGGEFYEMRFMIISPKKEPLYE